MDDNHGSAPCSHTASTETVTMPTLTGQRQAGGEGAPAPTAHAIAIAISSEPNMTVVTRAIIRHAPFPDYGPAVDCGSPAAGAGAGIGASFRAFGAGTPASCARAGKWRRSGICPAI